MFSSTIEDVLALVVVALLYLAIVRYLDVNEREPVWSILLAFVIGGAAAGALNLGVTSVTLNLDPWRGAAFREISIFVAVAIVFKIFDAIGRLRGWSEVTDVVDGLIYGMAVGLGFVCGEAIAQLGPASIVDVGRSGPLTTIRATALAGLAQGVFGAVIGAGFGLATSNRGWARWAWPFVGLSAAIVCHGAYQQLAFGNALGASAVLRGRLALAMPIVSLVALAAYGLATERRVIARELADESAAGYVTASEIALLERPWRRHLRYARALMLLQTREFSARPALHNRQVMLALAKLRAAGAADDQGRRDAEVEIAALRRSITAIRAQLDGAASASARGTR
ncbi:MAG: PrsW family glutamic-type intramembrane protease [Acidobacteriota bacterium]